MQARKRNEYKVWKEKKLSLSAYDMIIFTKKKNPQASTYKKVITNVLNGEYTKINWTSDQPPTTIKQKSKNKTINKGQTYLRINQQKKSSTQKTISVTERN